MKVLQYRSMKNPIPHYFNSAELGGSPLTFHLFLHTAKAGAGDPQGVGLGSVQIRVRVGLGPPARSTRPSARPSTFPSARPSARLSIRPSVRRSLHLVRLALILLVVCDICVSFGFLAKFLMFVTALEFEGVF